MVDQAIKTLLPTTIMTLPLDSLVDIFLKMQVKTLVWCCCVCKQWRKVIHSPYFTDKHCSRNSHEFMLFRHISSANTLQFYLLNPDFSSYKLPMAELTDDKSYSTFNYVGNGLFLVAKGDYEISSVFLYNPIRGEKLVLPPIFSFPDSELMVEHSYGLGFSNLSKRYKLVHVTHSFGRGNFAIKIAVEVYTLGSNKWERISSIPACQHIREYLPGITAYGDVHWRAGGSNMIVSFEFDTEEFKVTPLPNNLFVVFSLFNWRGNLGVIDRSFDTHMDIWVLRDYDNTRWEKLYNIELPGGLHQHLVGTWEDGFVFGVSRGIWSEDHTDNNDDARKLKYYDTRTDEITSMVNPAPLFSSLTPSNVFEDIISYTTNFVSLARHTDIVAEVS